MAMISLARLWRGIMLPLARHEVFFSVFFPCLFFFFLLYVISVVTNKNNCYKLFDRAINTPPAVFKEIKYLLHDNFLYNFKSIFLIKDY